VLTCFWLVVVCRVIQRWPSKVTAYFIIVFFALLNSLPHTKRQHPPIRSIPAVFPLHHPVHRFCQLLVDCFFLAKWQPPKANPPLSLCFLMYLVLSPQTREPAVAIANPALDACNRLIGSNGAMIWGCRCHVNGERAKPLDGAVAAAHFDCCVLCVYLWFSILCVGATFSYHTGRKSTLAEANWSTFAGS
jgi:hypothetical protein